MAYDSVNKILYTTSSRGLSIHEVSKCLTRSSLDLGQLCSDKAYDSTNKTFYDVNRINKKARYKPVRIPNDTTRLTEVKYSGSDYGFDTEFNSSTSMAYIGYVSAAISTLFQRATSNNYDWTYLKPRGEVNSYIMEWFRLLDFAGPLNSTDANPVGYNHKAEWEYYSTGGTTLDAGGLITVDFSRRTDRNAEIHPEELSVVTERNLDTTTLYPAVIKKQGSTYNLVVAPHNLAWYKTNSPNNIQVGSIQLPNDGVVETLYVLTSCTNPSDVDNEYFFMYLPLCHQVFTVDPTRNAVVCGGGYEGDNPAKFFHITITEGRISKIEAKAILTNRADVSRLVNITLEIRMYEDASSSGPHIESLSAQVTLTEAGYESETSLVELSKDDIQFDFPYRNNFEMRVRWQYSDSATETKYKCFNFPLNSIRKWNNNNPNDGFYKISDYPGYVTFIDEQ